MKFMITDYNLNYYSWTVGFIFYFLFWQVYISYFIIFIILCYEQRDVHESFFFYVMESLKKSPIVNNLLKLQYSKDVIYRTAI